MDEDWVRAIPIVNAMVKEMPLDIGRLKRLVGGGGCRDKRI